MTKKDLEEMQKMMILTFNNGFEQVVVPRLEDMEERLEAKMDESEKRIKDEFRDEFKKGQQSLSNRLETVERKMDHMDLKMDNLDSKMDQVITENNTDGKRLDKLERVIRAN